MKNQEQNIQPDYGQHGYSQSQQPYGQSGIPYSGEQYGTKRDSKNINIIVISVIAILIVVLATTLIVLLQKKNALNGGMMPSPPPPMGTMISISSTGAMINGRPASIEYFEENGKAFLKLEDIADTAGYDFVREGDRIKLLSQLELAIIELGSTQVTLQDQTTKTTTSVEILREPFDKDGDVFIYARDLSVFLKNTNVSYNAMSDSVEISIGMGGPGGPPPMGSQPQQPQPESQPEPPAGGPGMPPKR